MLSGYVGWEVMKVDFECVVVICKEVGQLYVVVFYWFEEKCIVEGYVELVEILNNGGKVCKEYGFKLVYYNYDFEFNKMVVGCWLMDMFLVEVDLDNVYFELDIYWIICVGSDY